MMVTERNNESVIAKLMGLHELPLKLESDYRPKRVLSESYLQKSASVGSRERRSSKIRKKNRKILEKSNSSLNDSSTDKQQSQSFDSHTTFGWELKKQLLERSKRAKVCQDIRSGIREVSSMADIESTQRLEPETRVLIRSNEGWKEKSVTNLPIIKHFDITSHSNSKFKKLDLRSNSSGRRINNLCVKFEFSSGDEGIKQINENVECIDSAKEGCFPCSSDVSYEQDSPCEDGFTSLNCIDIDEELRRITIEAYQPSPNSVLEPDNSSISEYGDNVSTDLHGLWTKLQLLKSESEENQSKPEIVTSSDGDTTEIQIRFGPIQSQQFSYLVSVLDEIGSFESFHSVEQITSPLNFERLEKKYGKQESWNKADRRLLFDRIKLGLSEIVGPYLDFIGCSKLLKRKMSTDLRRDVIEEELWNVVVSEGKEVNVGLSEKAVGKEPWLVLGEEVDSIVGEIEAFLFNELVLELVDF